MGTGLNLPYYDFGRVESLTGLDLSEGMLRQAAGKVTGLGPAAAAKVRLVQGTAARLPFGAGEFDTVVLTYVLCVLDDPLGALREITRVCKREGRVVLVEQTASDLGPLAAYQRALAPAVRATSKGEARAPGDWAGDWALTHVARVRPEPGRGGPGGAGGPAGAGRGDQHGEHDPDGGALQAGLDPRALLRPDPRVSAQTHYYTAKALYISRNRPLVTT